MSIVFVLEIAAAIAAFSLRSQVSEMLDERLRVTLPYYYQNPEVEDAFDFIQSRVSTLLQDDMKLLYELICLPILVINE